MSENEPPSHRFREWLADVPIISLVLLRLCYSDSGRSTVYAEWKWKRCREVVRDAE